MNIIVEEGVKIVFTSAGNPKTWTAFLKEKGIKPGSIQGVYITGVQKGSAAAEAGLKEGDIITSINGNEINPRLRVNPGAVPPFNEADGVALNAPEPIVWEQEIVLNSPSTLLREGTNVLAVQLINTTSGSSDLYLDAELKYPTSTSSP